MIETLVRHVSLKNIKYHAMYMNDQRGSGKTRKSTWRETKNYLDEIVMSEPFQSSSFEQ